MSNTIADNLARLQQAKSNIANAIIAKGGTVNSGDGLEDFATDIGTIPSGGSSNKDFPSPKPIILKAPSFTSSWSAKTWTGLTSFNGLFIWTDGNDIYFSGSSSQYVLSKSSTSPIPTTKMKPGYI